MEIEIKAQIEKILDHADSNFGEWKIVIQKNGDGKIRCHTQFPTDIYYNTNQTESHLTSIRKSLILITE